MRISWCHRRKYIGKPPRQCYTNNSIFNEKHKSYYTDTDIDILNECRTIVPSGIIKKPEVEKKVAEIDINKAFTKAFTSIKTIPMSRQFNIWRKWSSKLNTDDMPSLTLYMVEVKEANMMFNKKNNLIYGKFLKKLITRGAKCNIVYYKQPSQIHKVDYKQIIEDLWAEPVSEINKKTEGLRKRLLISILDCWKNPATKGKRANCLIH